MDGKGKTRKDVLQPVDDQVLRQCKAMLRTARCASLATLDPNDGSPLASRVNIGTTLDGRLIFLISGLSAHSAALQHDTRCSLLVGEPGQGDALAHPRMSLTGHATICGDTDARAALRRRFLHKHPKSQIYIDLPDFTFWIFSPIRTSFNGGFAKACEPQPHQLLCDMADLTDLEGLEEGAVDHMNDDHKDAIDGYAQLAGRSESGWVLTGIDPEGVDISRGDVMERVWFATPMRSPSELRAKLVELAKTAKGQ